jgi:hypothetical protein
VKFAFFGIAVRRKSGFHDAELSSLMGESENEFIEFLSAAIIVALCARKITEKISGNERADRDYKRWLDTPAQALRSINQLKNFYPEAEGKLFPLQLCF